MVTVAKFNGLLMNSKSSHIRHIIGGTDQNVEARLGKAMSIVTGLDKLWKSKAVGRVAEVKMCNLNMNEVLLYASASTDRKFHRH